MTIFEIAKALPNGFHDSELGTIHIDYPNQSIHFALDVWVGTIDPPSAREMYRAGRLSITGLQYCAMDLPDERYPYARRDTLRIDLHEATAFIPPGASFACRLWIDEWNGFIHLAAQEAEFVWTGEPVNRQRGSRPGRDHLVADDDPS
jgi:hypothetical protein